ncbi:hypothetical protein E3E35_01205 [Thermococcus sp. GR7]|uniref:hypothetical protein n=1 Tax=unclassified Thermococcus TaxID=2627626 RepID=UPI00142FA8FC|nr:MULTISPECIES: hypothetical protein [unclassified Thermococcus]NJE46047.1 hypothetical protein [Thermococcus sp. GR7]NJE79359.1 hypothetical protein [Thermococcus sp. GR4]NJF22244.1 hypothetical protein [Thermococcus sp. GR5]
MEEKPTLLARLWLFLSSYVPLWIILLVQTYDGVTGFHTILFVLLIVSSLVSLFRFLSVARQKLNVGEGERICDNFIVVDDYQEMNHVYLEYLVTYVVSLLSFIPSGQDVRNLLTFVVFMGLVFILYLRANLIYANPVLGALGYNIFKVKNRESGQWVLLITRKDKILIADKTNPERLCVSSLSGNIYLEVED